MRERRIPQSEGSTCVISYRDYEVSVVKEILVTTDSVIQSGGRDMA
jgi:hypothetical protein